MTWTKIGAELPDNPRLLALPRGVRWMHVEAIIWSNKQGTDGHIAAVALPRITDEPNPLDAAAQLQQAGLWEGSGDGWDIVDFLDDQPSRADVERQAELNRARVRRARLHGQGDHSECTDWCKAKKREANALAGAGNAAGNAAPNALPNGEASNGADLGNPTNAISNGYPVRSVPSVPSVPSGTVRIRKGTERAGAALAASAGATADAGAASGRPRAGAAVEVMGRVSHVTGCGQVFVGTDSDSDAGEAVRTAQAFVEAAQTLELSLGGWPAGWKLDADEVADGYAALTIPAAEAARVQQLTAALGADVKRRLGNGIPA